MKCKELLEKPFYEIAKWIAQHWIKKESVKYQKTKQMLDFVKTEEKERDVLEFTTRKIEKAFIIGFFGLGFCLFFASFQKNRIEISTLERPSYGEGSKEIDLNVQMEGEKDSKKISLTIQEQKYSEEEVEKLLESAAANMEQVILGANQSLEDVRYDLNFPEVLENGKVSVQWMTDPITLVDSTGKILCEPSKKGELVLVTALLSCQEKEAEHSFFICVYPPEQSKEERWMKKVKESVQEAESESVEQREIKLPEQVEEKKVYWTETDSFHFAILGSLVLLVAICVAVLEEEKIQEEVKKKRMGLLMEYPAFLYKMTALLRAGLTIRGVFEKAADGKEIRNCYINEEIKMCCNEIKSGVPEAQAYENFGRRCQLTQYRKIGMILAQNLRKGSDGLADLLEAEALRGMEERQNLAKKLGEQAGTKLLLPMMLMLCVVLVILMAPAFMSFSV